MKVLRVLQEGEIMRIGGIRQIKVDVRIIAATNRDMRSACRSGAFREDLFYRLNVINIHLPPLRDRIADIPALVKHFMRKHASKRKDILIKCITQDSVDILMNHSYPGNVRELENIIERAISFTNCSEILPSDLPSFLLHPPSGQRNPTPKLRAAIASLERDLIVKALNEAEGNISHAAAALGVYRQQLQRKIKQLGIST
jgi:transcriptional regulator with PAS, ATPase and Fis domain